MEYPIHVKTADEAVYYRISSPSVFDEWRRLGSRYLYTPMEAKDYMDRLYIRELISSVDKGLLISISEEEFKLFRSKVTL